MSKDFQIKKQEKLAKQNELSNKIMMIPVILLLAVMPLVIRVEMVMPSDYVVNVLRSAPVFDFFSQYKAILILMLTGVMVLITFFLFQKEQLKKDKLMLTYVIAIGVFFLFSLLSTAFSPYKEVALWGLPDRAEGMVMTTCYIVMLFYTLYTFKNQKNYRVIIGALSVLILITTFLGIFQYIGKDLILGTEFGNKLVIPKSISDQVEALTPQYEKGKVYGTMFHYNYMGSFGAMMVPLFVTLTLFIKGYKKKIGLAVITVSSMFLLFGSTSRAGLIGVAFALLIGMIVFGKKMIKGWKIGVPLVIICAVIIIVFNAATAGAIFERVPTLISDAVGLFGPADNTFDYKDHIPVRDIIMHEGQATIALQQQQLTVKQSDKSVQFVDQEGYEVPYVYDQGKYTTTDARFSFVTFQDEILVREENAQKGLLVSVEGTKAFILKIDSGEGVYLIDPFTEEKITIQYPETYGFRGKERLGSARGYIWSRSIPLLKDTLLVGTGPDTYAMIFPQNDLLGKWWAYETPQMIIDKPHNLYLQIGINNGVVALIAFLIVMGVYLIDSMRLYALQGSYKTQEIMGAATMLAVSGYLGAGLFNDSIVSVAPIFWILLGTGMAVNYYVRKDRRSV